MAIIFGAAAALRDAGGCVPRAVVAVEELILTDALPLVVKVDVLQKKMLKKTVETGGTCSIRMLERCRMQLWVDTVKNTHKKVGAMKMEKGKQDGWLAL